MTTQATIQTPEIPWVKAHMDLFPSIYLGDHGMMITNMNADGSADIDEPVVADFGDILPFLWYFGMHEFSIDQIEKTSDWCRKGLYISEGRTRLFFNHDWLLGLIDLYRQSGRQELLSMAEEGASTIGEDFFHGGLLMDERMRLDHWRSWLKPASPFNGGYIELWVDLYRATDDVKYLEYARRLASGWIGTADFKNYGLFSRKLCAWSESLNKLVMLTARLRTRLFKDNTNLVWGILILYQQTGERQWLDAIVKWITGFERHFFNGGDVVLMLDMNLNPYNSSLKAGFSSLDLLCDLHHAGIDQERVLRLAESVADFWIRQQWDNGLFPEFTDGNHDHLDANVDIVVGLAKLFAITGDNRYLDSLSRCRQAILRWHKGPMGYCQSVDKLGNAVDDHIKIKYQGLIIKLALLPDDPSDLFDRADLLELLRDR